MTRSLSSAAPLPPVLVALRRRQLDQLPKKTLRALYGSLPGRENVSVDDSLLSRHSLIDIIIWTEYADWFRVKHRGGHDVADLSE